MNSGSSAPPPPAPPRVPNHYFPPSRKPVQKFTSADVRMQEALVYMPAFSVDSSGQGRSRSDLRSYDRGRYVQQSAPRVSRPNIPKPGGPPSGPRYMSVISNKRPFNGIPAMVRPPIPKLPPSPRVPTIYTTAPSPSRNEPVLVKDSFFDSTPPSRVRKDGRGHRRGPFAAITNIAHVGVPENDTEYPAKNSVSVSCVSSERPDLRIQKPDPFRFADSLYACIEDTPSPTTVDLSTPSLVHSPSPTPSQLSTPSTAEPSTPSPLDYPSPTTTDSPGSTFFDTSVPQQGRNGSLRRRPAYEDLHSPSPPRLSPKKRSISRLWFNPPEPPSVSPSKPNQRCISPSSTNPRSISPLRINKRAEASSPTMYSNSRSPPSEDDLQDVVSKVRAVFELLREGEEDEANAAREKFNRDSARTTGSHTSRTAPVGAAGRPQPQRDEVEESEEEEYGNEVSVRSMCSPPPPYALSPGIAPCDMYADLKRDSPLDAFKFMKEERPSHAFAPVPKSNIPSGPSPEKKPATELRRQNSRSPVRANRNFTPSPSEYGSPLRSVNLQVPFRSAPSNETLAFTPTLTPAASTELAYYGDSPNRLLKPTVSNFSLTTAVSTELSYLKEDASSAPPSPVKLVTGSVDSSLDDILENFEHLIHSMGFKVRPPTPTPEVPRLVVPSPSPRKLAVTKPAPAKSAYPGKTGKSRPDTGCYVYGGLADECDAQWCDLLELDGYDSG